jgi:hypothetical protein
LPSNVFSGPVRGATGTLQVVLLLGKTSTGVREGTRATLAPFVLTDAATQEGPPPVGEAAARLFRSDTANDVDGSVDI